MRNIKFRVWDNCLGVQGYLDTDSVFLMANGSCLTDDIGDEIDMSTSTIEQYTGIDDRMGKEIYEGDIVEVSEYQRGGHTILDEQTFGMIEQWDDIDTAIRGVVAIWASKGAVLTNITVEEPEQFEGTDYNIPKWLPLRKNELVVGNINAMPEALTDYD